jgi:hypothetical protein
MAGSNETKTVTSKSPSYYSNNVRSREGRDNYWKPISSAWAHNDGNGFNTPCETRIARYWPKSSFVTQTTILALGQTLPLDSSQRISNSAAYGSVTDVI